VPDTKIDWPTDRRSYYTSDLELTQLRDAVVRSEKLVAEAGDSSGVQKKVNVRFWKPLPSNG
jgi:hypothetical protein